jgi:hypothetical protein
VAVCAGEELCEEVGGVEPLTPTVETSPAAHIAPIVRARMRRGVNHPM